MAARKQQHTAKAATGTSTAQRAQRTESATQGDMTEANEVKNKSLLVQLQKDIKQDLPLFSFFFLSFINKV